MPGKPKTPKTPKSAGSARSPTGGGSSLYDRYAAVPVSNSPTRSSMLRQGNIRLNCYLNCEGVGVVVIGGPKGHGTMVQLPIETNTLEEVYPLIQTKLKLDEKMLYCADLFLPDGARVTSFEQPAAS